MAEGRVLAGVVHDGLLFLGEGFVRGGRGAASRAGRTFARASSLSQR